MKVNFPSKDVVLYTITWQDGHTTLLHVSKGINAMIMKSNREDLEHLVGLPLHQAIEWILSMGCSYRGPDGREGHLLG